ncbi:cupredoxin domain-containing protein [Novosphingobium sp. HR1a]|nr:cupredoxin domain-containing protein [Novosphingobium sp. HR1a]
MIAFRMTDVRLVAVAILMLAPLEAASQGGPPAADWSHAETLAVELSSFKFAPSTITMKQGRTYDLHLTNVSSGGHDFAAREFFAAAQVMDGDRARITGGKVSLDAGQSIDVHLVAPAAGSYKVRCTHLMHSTFGMTGEIVVQ